MNRYARPVPTAEQASVALKAVDEVVLEQLVQAAKDALADEVTPPVTAGTGWTEARVAWLRSFHQDRRTGLSGPAGEATWAVIAGDRVVGSVRLKLCGEKGLLETGLWLARASRDRGIGQAAIRAVLHQAAALGARGVFAETLVENARALGVLRRLHFDLKLADNGRDVRALLMFDEKLPHDRRR